MIVTLLLFVFSLSHGGALKSNSTSVYYVNSKQHSCSEECHLLSYYTKKTDWSPNTTLIFLPGEHELNAHLIIEKLDTVILKGLGNDPPVIKCTEEFLMLKIKDCNAVNIEGIAINCSLLSLVDNNATIVTNIIANQSHYRNAKISSVFSNVTISHSKFMCDEKSANNCVGIYHDTGWIILQNVDLVSSAKHGIDVLSSGFNGEVNLHNIFVTGNNYNGIVITLNQQGKVNLYDVSAIGNKNDGIEIILNQNGMLNLTGVNVSYNTQNGLLLGCPNNSLVYLENITACLSDIGIKLSYSDNNSVSITNSNLKRVQIGIAILQGSHNELHLVNVTTNTTENGVRFYYQWAFDINIIHLAGVIMANSSQPALQAICYSYCQLILTNVTITNNLNTGIFVTGKWNITFANHPSVISNNKSPANGGGMWVDKNSRLTGCTEVYFINNTAQGMGGAIFVNEVRYSTFVYIYSTFKNFTPIFQNNSALVSGDNIYNGIYHGRIASSDEFPNNVNCKNISFSKYVTSSPLGVCVCGNDSTVNCNDRSLDGVIYPGQFITLSLVTVGACGGISPSVLVTSDTQSIEVVHADINQETLKSCKNFTYTINKKGNIENQGTFQIGIRKSAANVGLKNAHISVSIKFMQCPLGLRVVSGSCQCDDIIGAVNGTHCDINRSPHHISRSGNNWLFYSEEYHCVVAHTNCPFDYCDSSTVQLSLNESDVQCTNGRSGILCGRCQPGLSLMLGSNKCQNCSYRYILLMIAFIFAGIVLVVFLIVSDLTVSSGCINGLLFYANIVKLNEANFFSNGASIPVLSQFIAWLNLDLGIQTCFFNGLNSYWKTWLQFVFPLYIWLLIGIVIAGCHYSTRMARLCGNNGVPVLATLIFMSYTKLLRTITNILMLAVINCNQTNWVVWSIDGNIGYLNGKHIPLFSVALLFFLFGLLYTGFVFSAQWLQRYSGKCFKSSHDPVIKLKPFIDAYTGPYQDQYRYWTGLLLIIRLLLTTVFSYTTGTIPEINNYIIAVVAAILLYESRNVYRANKLNILEAFYLINLGVMAQLNAVSVGMNLHISNIVTSISISLSMIPFIAIVTLPVITKIAGYFHTRCSCIKNDIETRDEEEREPLLINQEELHSPASVVMRRESIIYDFNT
uniref:Right handed beta helix domain-containing protein n=1 Tax=Amphimedon queenslandica TaxID=400682 RepID=A0A1X7VK55_AMPQE